MLLTTTIPSVVKLLIKKYLVKGVSVGVFYSVN